jgi:hypothetical protein
MKNIVSSQNERIVQNVTLASNQLNKPLDISKLKLDDYENLFAKQFDNHVKQFKFDAAKHTKHDKYIIYKLKEYQGSLKSETESWKSFLRAYQVTLVRDVRGFHFQLIILPRNIHEPIQDFVINKMTSSLSRVFSVNMTQEKNRTVFRLTPTFEVQLELMKSEGLPMMALSLGIELNPFSKCFEIMFLWNSQSRIDSNGFYREY